MPQSNTIVFEVVDPRGRVVICTEERWYGHILFSRPFMEKWKDEIIATIENPSFGIFQDAHFPNRCIYYRRQSKPRYLKVVVAVSENGPDKVVTAYLTDSMKPGEKWIWTPSSD